MTLLIISLVFLVAIVFLILRKHRISAVFGAVGLCLFMSIGTGEFPSFMLGKLQKEYLYESYPNWQDKNVIILLGMAVQKIGTPDFDNVLPGTFAYSRILKTAELYKSCVEYKPDCLVIISGGDPQKIGATEADVYASHLERLGVDPDRILKERESRNTFENAKFTSNILSKLGDRVKVLVTSGIHMERSAMYFKHFGVTKLHLVPSDYFSAKFSLVPIAYNFAIADFALHEFIGMVRYNLYNAMGWNPPKPGAGVAKLFTMEQKAIA